MYINEDDVLNRLFCSGDERSKISESSASAIVYIHFTKMNSICAYIKRIQLKGPLDKCLHVQYWANTFLKPLGIPIASPFYKPYWFSYSSVVLILALFVCSSYTVFYYWLRAKYVMCLEASCIVGVLFPVN